MKIHIKTCHLSPGSFTTVFPFLAIAISVSATTFSMATEAPIVTLTTGMVLGKRVSPRNDFLEQVDQYLGIPYAKSPTGDNRFRETSYPADSWSSIRNATEFGPVCPQTIAEISSAMPRWRQKPIEDSKPFLEYMDEDCLYLNVYVPIRSK